MVTGAHVPTDRPSKGRPTRFDGPRIIPGVEIASPAFAGAGLAFGLLAMTCERAGTDYPGRAGGSGPPDEGDRAEQSQFADDRVYAKG